MRPLLPSLAALLLGCNEDPMGQPPLDAAGDLAHQPLPTRDLAVEIVDPGPCGDFAPGCMLFSLGPLHGKPFPLRVDNDPHEQDIDIGRDSDGFLGIEVHPAPADNLWIPNSTDLGRGTVSKLSAKQMREVARYLSVTCSSLPGGSVSLCDGQTGCCSADDSPRFAARRALTPEPPHQAVQTDANYPSRTTLDFDGSLWIENRAPGGQASLTKILNDARTCPDRNKNHLPDTSSDVNGDGLIDTDCNGDGQPDDLASVKSRPCSNGLPQEFYGLDDECVLLTTNVGAPHIEGRGLTLGPGASDFGPSDAWASTVDGHLSRVGGSNGRITDEATLPIECRPNSLVTDSSAIGWSTALGPGPLCWFRTKNPTDNGLARSPRSGRPVGGVVNLDRDQNLWVAGAGASVYRYTPDRKANRPENGFWTEVLAPGVSFGASGAGRSIVSDSRTPNAYFTWLARDGGWVVRIPSSTLPLPQNGDIAYDGALYPTVSIGALPLSAIDVDLDGNLAVVSGSPAVAVRVSVDPFGAPALPDLLSPPTPNTRCPAGSRCVLDRDPNHPLGSDAHTSFAQWPSLGGGHGSITGVYRYTVDGCPGQTVTWHKVTFDADLGIDHANTVTLRARTGPTPDPDPSWGAFSPPFDQSPARLTNGMPVPGNATPSATHLQLELQLATQSGHAGPQLRGLQVAYRCNP